MRDPTPTRAAIETVWRIEAARLIGGLVRFVRDVDRRRALGLSTTKRRTGCTTTSCAWC